MEGEQERCASFADWGLTGGAPCSRRRLSRLPAWPTPTPPVNGPGYGAEASGLGGGPPPPRSPCVVRLCRTRHHTLDAVAKQVTQRPRASAPARPGLSGIARFNDPRPSTRPALCRRSSRSRHVAVRPRSQPSVIGNLLGGGALSLGVSAPLDINVGLRRGERRGLTLTRSWRSRSGACADARELPELFTVSPAHAYRPVNGLGLRPACGRAPVGANPTHRSHGPSAGQRRLQGVSVTGACRWGNLTHARPLTPSLRRGPRKTCGRSARQPRGRRLSVSNLAWPPLDNAGDLQATSRRPSPRVAAIDILRTCLARGSRSSRSHP